MRLLAIIIQTIYPTKMLTVDHRPNTIYPCQPKTSPTERFLRKRESFVNKLREYGDGLCYNNEAWVETITVSVLQNLAIETSSLRDFQKEGLQFHRCFDLKIDEVTEAIRKACDMLHSEGNFRNEAGEILRMVSLQIGRLRIRDTCFMDRFASHMDERADRMDLRWQTLAAAPRERVAWRQRVLKGIWDDLYCVNVRCDCPDCKWY